MNPSGNDPDDKLVVDPEQLQLRGPDGARPASEPGDGGGVVRARGTREQLPVAGVPAAPRALARERPRDPAEVLRTWPVSMANEARKPAQRAAPAAPPKPRVEDKITLAHLALDLFREVEQLHATPRRAGTEPELAPCTNPGCDARIKALRGALIEACLLVQRVVMTPAPERADIEDRIRELLALLDG